MMTSAAAHLDRGAGKIDFLREKVHVHVFVRTIFNADINSLMSEDIWKWDGSEVSA